MRGNARRAGVFVAPECLNASQRKHEAPRRHAEIGANTERPGYVRWGDQLPGCNDFDPFTQTVRH